jgi:hypothetical protein
VELAARALGEDREVELRFPSGAAIVRSFVEAAPASARYAGEMRPGWQWIEVRCLTAPTATSPAPDQPCLALTELRLVPRTVG